MQGFWPDVDAQFQTHLLSAGTYPQIKMTSQRSEIIMKMSSVMPFVFNAVELCVVTINEKHLARARQVCRALKYSRATKAADVVR